VSNWRWISLNTVLAAHDRALADYGGADGVRDLGGLEGALARPRNLSLYGRPDTADLTAAHAVAIAKAHAFVDGNKRTAWTIANAFAWLNGHTLTYDKAEAVALMVRVAGGDISAEALAEWFRVRLRRR
jgi:death-on-curing protein